MHEAEVLLVNALQARGKWLEKHEPWLHFNPAACDVAELPVGAKKGCMNLSEYTVELGHKGDPTIIPRLQIPRRARPDEWGPETQFQWVALLNTIFRDNPPALDARCNDAPDKDKPVISRIALGGGRLESSRMGKYFGEAVRWDFKSSQASPSIWNQAMTEWVTWTVGGFDTEVKINLRKTGGNATTISLKPENGEDTVRIVIENSPTDPSTSSDPRQLHHFRWFYQLLDPKPKPGPIPMTNHPPDLAVISCPCGKAHMTVVGGNAFCPPASFEV